MLRPPAQRAHYQVWEPVLVRWGDMDAFQHVNNARYFTYCESARIRYFDEIQLDRHRERSDLGPAVVSATCNFLRQVRHPARLEVGVRATEIGRSSFTLDYGIFPEGEEQPVADGVSTVVWVDYQAERAVRLPEALAQTIRKLDGLE